MRCLIIAVLIAGAAAAGCARQQPAEPIIKIQEAKVAVAVRCKPDLGADPAYPDSSAALAAVPHPDAVTRLKANAGDVQALTDALDNLGYQLKLLLKGRLQRMQRDREKTAAIEGCKGPPQ